jgi:hypothetical protein
MKSMQSPLRPKSQAEHHTIEPVTANTAEALYPVVSFFYDFILFVMRHVMSCL